LSAADLTPEVPRRPQQRIGGRRVNLGDLILQLVAGAAAAGASFLVILITYKVVEGARPAIEKYGIEFVTRVAWDPVKEVFGAGSFLFGTVITSLCALLIAAPLAIGIALFLTELAPRVVRAPVTALVETLAAIPSVVLGLWGILVLGPILRDHVEPWLHDVLGFIPLFGTPAATGSSIFTAIVVLTIMIIPIVSSISRELFLGVPARPEGGPLALGTTRWEMVRGSSSPTPGAASPPR
jgi:ABC-type phosphate transport system, permease component